MRVDVIAKTFVTCKLVMYIKDVVPYMYKLYIE